MGSCSSGGPNKFPGMCLVKGDAKKEDANSRQANQTLSVAKSDYGKRSGHDSTSDDLSRRHTHEGASKNKSPTERDTRPTRTDRVAASSSRTHSQRGNYVSSSETGFREAQSSSVFGTTACDQGSRTGATIASKSIVEHSDLEQGNAPIDSRNRMVIATTKEVVGAAASTPVSSDNAPAEPDLPKQRHYRYHGRKGSTPVQSYRWPGEYGNCIVAPPNKTVYDAYRSPQGHLDYSTHSTWGVCWDDQTSDYYDRHKPPVPTVSGCAGGEKTNSCGLLPSGGLSATSSDPLSWHSAESSSSDVDCVFRHRDGGAKRSNSVGTCPSTVSSTAELIPSSTRNGDGVDLHRRRVSTSENRPLAVSQRLWNLLRSPMEPLNGEATVGSASKYVTLNSDLSSQTDEDVPAVASKANNSISNNKNSNSDGQT